MIGMIGRIILIGLCNYAFGEILPKVTIPLGVIKGSIQKSIKGRNYYSFKGIPYAKPPVGSLRFKEPMSPDPWLGTWSANDTYICLQYNHYYTPGKSKVEGEEDCLYVNIHTPTLDSNANLDVLIYIHGGAFMFNHGNVQGPEYLMDRKLVHASLNYRLGPLGFISTENDIIPGNNGLKDQILALKFLKDNIQYFGGNPNSITISGMSAGGASVHFHYLMSQSKELFHRGISQSGVASNPWVLMEQPLQQTRKLASAIGCPTNTIDRMVECLISRPGRQIVNAVGHLQPWLYNPFSPFGIVIDSWASKPLLPQHPRLLIQKNMVQDLPWLASYVQSEGLYPASEFYREENLEYLKENLMNVLPHILHYNFTIDSSKLNHVTSKIIKYYFEEKKLNKETFMKLVEMIGDRLFLVDIEKCVRVQARVMKSPVYVYKFSYRGVNSASDDRTGTKINLGASHADDTSYIFKTSIDTWSSANDRKIVEKMLDMVESFMKTGKPTIPDVKWDPIEKNSAGFQQLHIKNPENIKMEIVKQLGHREFWDEIPFVENERLFDVKDEL